MEEKISNFQNTALEEKLLGQIIKYNDLMTDIIDKIDYTDFTTIENQKIYIAIKSLYKENTNIDITNIKHKIGNDSKINEQDLVSIMVSTNSNDKYEWIIKQIKDMSNKRKIYLNCQQLMKKLDSQNVDYMSEFSKMQENSILIDTDTDNSHSLAELNEMAMKKSVDASIRGDDITGMRTGLTDLDTGIDGIEKQQLTIIGGRPAVGKTTLLVTMLKGLAKENKVYFFSLEQSDIRLTNKIQSQDTRIDAKNIKHGTIGSLDFKKINDLTKKYESYDLRIDSTPSLTVEQMERIIKRQKLRHGLDVVAIDYLGIMGRDERLNTNLAIGKIVRGLQIIARKYDVAIIILSQFNRFDENAEPTLMNLRDSGEIEQCGDKILLLHIDKENQPDILKVIVAKNKDGENGSVYLNFDKNKQSLSSKYGKDKI